MGRSDNPLGSLLKSEVDIIVERMVSEELDKIATQLENYYMAYIRATTNHFARCYGFKPDMVFSRGDIENGFKICIEVRIPNYIINEVY